MEKDRNTEGGKLRPESIGGILSAVLSNHDRTDVKADVPEKVNEPEHLKVICNVEVAAPLSAFDCARTDGNDDLRLIFKLKQHPQLAVRLKARKNAGSVVVVKELSAELHIELSAEARHSLSYLLGLGLDIFFVVESFFEHLVSSQLSL